MQCVGVLVMIGSLVLAADAGAQRRRPSPRKPPPPPPLQTEPAEVSCPETLGTGVKTGAVFCFVLAGRDPAAGVLVTIPPHTGPATLLFDIHNRHTYSDEDVRAGRGFAKYTAVIGVLTLKGELLSRGAVQSEFRTARDLYDRVSGGAGPRSARCHHVGGTRNRDARTHGRHHQQRPD
jgi:hypothetical protein